MTAIFNVDYSRRWTLSLKSYIDNYVNYLCAPDAYLVAWTLEVEFVAEIMLPNDTVNNQFLIAFYYWEKSFCSLVIEFLLNAQMGGDNINQLSSYNLY